MADKPRFAGERVPFGQAFKEVSRGVRKFKQNEYQGTGRYPIVDQGKSLNAGYSDEVDNLFVDVPAIVFGDHTRAIKYIDQPFFVGADGVKILKPLLSDNVRFWYHVLRSVNIENLGYSRHFKLLKEEFFINPAPEQQALVCNTLDAILFQIESADKVLALLDALIKSRFVEMFGDPISNESHWERRALSDTCKIITGNTPSRKDALNYGSYIEWCKTDNITEAKYITAAAEMLSETGATKGRIAPVGSILMACIAGSIKSIGKVAVADRPIAFNQQINAIIPGDRLMTDYLLWAFKLSKDYLCSNVNMQLKGILNKSALSSKEFPLPPLALQQEFANFVAQVDKSRFVATQGVESIMGLSECDTLFNT